MKAKLKSENSIDKIREMETDRIANEFDFADLERVTGHELSFHEKCLAIYQFNEFVSLLKDEYGKMLKAEIFISDISTASNSPR